MSGTPAKRLPAHHITAGSLSAQNLPDPSSLRHVPERARHPLKIRPPFPGGSLDRPRPYTFSNAGECFAPPLFLAIKPSRSRPRPSRGVGGPPTGAITRSFTVREVLLRSFTGKAVPLSWVGMDETVVLRGYHAQASLSPSRGGHGAVVVSPKRDQWLAPASHTSVLPNRHYSGRGTT